MNKSNVFEKEEKVLCENCGKDLMLDPEMSMVQIVDDMTTKKITRIVPCCKGECDNLLKLRLEENESDGWKDLSEFINPILYLKHIMSVLNNMYDGIGFANEEAFEEYKSLVIRCYPYVTRDMTEEEIKSCEMSFMFPF